MQFSAFAQSLLVFNQSDFDSHQCQTEVSFQVLHSLVQSYRDQVGMFYKPAYIGRQSLSPGHKIEIEVYQLEKSDFAAKKRMKYLLIRHPRPPRGPHCNFSLHARKANNKYNKARG